MKTDKRRAARRHAPAAANPRIDGVEASVSKWSSSRLDPRDYLHFMQGDSRTEAEKLAWIYAVGEIVCGFVDMAFNNHPVQQAIEWKSTEGTASDAKPSARRSPSNFT